MTTPQLNFLSVACLLVLLALPLASAQVIDDEISEEDQVLFDQILEPVIKIYNLVKYIATVIAVLILLLAGIHYITSGSEPKKRENAKNMAMYVLIGLVIIWAAPLVVQYVIG